METFGDLTITLAAGTADEFADRAAAVATRGWARDRSRDDQPLRDRGAWFTFTLTGHRTLPPAFLFVASKRALRSLHVPNIISPARDRLGYGEYNAILCSFRDDVLQQIEPAGEVAFAVTGTSLDLASGLPAGVFERLRRFSAAANKSTGSSHPFDRERWMDFLIQAAEAPAELDPHTLGRWLVEEAGWGPDEAARLAEQYEFGRELLERNRRRAS